MTSGQLARHQAANDRRAGTGSGRSVVMPNRRRAAAEASSTRVSGARQPPPSRLSTPAWAKSRERNGTPWASW